MGSTKTPALIVDNTTYTATYCDCFMTVVGTRGARQRNCQMKLVATEDLPKTFILEPTKTVFNF